MDYNDLDDTKKKLNEVGCGFCLAKWNQVTMHLQMGRTHSCHHPDTHLVPLKELTIDPSALHNTFYKKKLRNQMLEGKRPKECEYCWNVEDNSEQYSDRIYKSSEEWAFPDLEKIKKSNWRDNVNPKYVEVAFSNTCNFKCSYCGPSFSSQWLAEVEKYGGYPLIGGFNSLDYLKEHGKLPFNGEERTPYLDAFWKWWPDLYRDLDTFRITGGEPLLSKDTWNILDYIINEKTPNRNLKISINTNLGVPDKLINDFINKINNIHNDERVKELVVYTSVDGWGEQAEYGRHGLVFNKFWDNINKILYRCPSVTIGIMSTYNIFSIPSYPKLIDEVFKLKKEYASMNRAWTTPIVIDSSYLRHPDHQTVRILPVSFAEQIKLQSEQVESLREIFQVGVNQSEVNFGFTQMEGDKIMRIYDWMISPIDNDKLFTDRKNFITFVDEHDRRRGTNFLKTFPEYEEFYKMCKKY